MIHLIISSKTNIVQTIVNTSKNSIFLDIIFDSRCLQHTCDSAFAYDLALLALVSDLHTKSFPLC